MTLKIVIFSVQNNYSVSPYKVVEKNYITWLIRDGTQCDTQLLYRMPFSKRKARKMQKFCEQIADDAFREYGSLTRVCEMISNEMEDKFGGLWVCIAGQDFGS